VKSVLGESHASAGLDLLELVEYAWHDCYGEITPPDDVILNILICSRGDLATMIHAARVALRDWRDLHLWAEHVNSEQQKLIVERCLASEGSLPACRARSVPDGGDRASRWRVLADKPERSIARLRDGQRSVTIQFPS
jgi:hypothetical protein